MKFELKTLDDYSDESLLNELRSVSNQLNGERLTLAKFNELSRVHSTTLRYRFGTWKNALNIAGISESVAPRFNPLSRETILKALLSYAKEFPGQPVTAKQIADRIGIDRNSISRKFGNWQDLLNEVGLKPVPLGRRYTDEECYENIVNLWSHYGRQPNFTELKLPPSKVGSKAYIIRWGGWRAALAAFIKYINQAPQTSTPAIALQAETQALVIQNSAEITPRSISLALRYKILSRDKFKCVTCGRSPAKDPSIELHVDHIHPWSKGGQNTEENLRTLCFDCNLGKGSKIERPL